MATYKRECVALAAAGGGYADHREATRDFFACIEGATTTASAATVR
jgi:hypothetical protein